MDATCDVALIGAGIVGLATGLALLDQNPRLRLAIIEKEAEVAAHQTGHNSGVLHAGIYYKPGSLKARLCVTGVQQMIAFCQEHGVPYDLCGKLIVATDQRELALLDELMARGVANGVLGLRRIGPEEMREIEPEAAGIGAIHSPGTGIVDYPQAARVMAALLQSRGARLITRAAVTGIHRDGDGVRIETSSGDVRAKRMINCAGLYADTIARMAGLEPQVRIIPFRGEYHFLRPERQDLVRGLIYPVADPRLPFLGVHFTRMIDGRMEVGPNAVLALAREGYTRFRIHPGELWETLSYGGFWALARRYWSTGVYEYYRSFSKAALVRSLQKLVPAVRAEDLLVGGAGVRAQAVTRTGELLYDFHVVHDQRGLHLLNAPSPAATASLAIGAHVANMAREVLALDQVGR